MGHIGVKMDRFLPETTPYDGVPYAGCAATEVVGSDCYPATVMWVSPSTLKVGDREVPRFVRISLDRYKVISGHGDDGSARYAYSRDIEDEPESGALYSYRPRLMGYVRVGIRSDSTAAQTLGLGWRRAYRDPSF